VNTPGVHLGSETDMGVAMVSDGCETQFNVDEAA
jgi:hypothetical protein